MKRLLDHIEGLDLSSLSKEFAAADPFPHIVIDNFLTAETADALLKEHEEIGNGDGWGKYYHYNERKLGLTKLQKMGPVTQETITFLSSEAFLEWLNKLTGIDALLADPDLDGGGLHKIERNGHLNIHADYLAHTTRPTWSRQLNLLIYLNKDWDSAWNGQLELWDADMTSCIQKVDPIFNRAVIFRTSEKSYHGHPDPVLCPEDRARRSLALYYFRDEGEELSLKPTYYRARPDESSMKHNLVALDRLALRVYSIGKRYLARFGR